jgi:hypothetical protein
MRIENFYCDITQLLTNGRYPKRGQSGSKGTDEAKNAKNMAKVAINRFAVVNVNKSLYVLVHLVRNKRMQANMEIAGIMKSSL